MAAQGMAYRGADRRRGASSNTLPMAVTAGAIGLLVIVGCIVVLAAQDVRLPLDRADRINDLARMVIPVGAGAAFATCLVRWRLTGVATVLWIGFAVLVFGVVVVGVAIVALPIVLTHTTHGSWIAAVRAAGLLVSVALFVLALVMPPVDVRVRPLRLGLLVAAGGAVLIGVLVAVPAVGGVIAFGRRSNGLDAHPTDAQWTVSVVVWLALGVPFLVRGLRLRYPLMAWTGMMLLALALGAVFGTVSEDPRDLWVLGHQALRAGGMLFVLIGCVGDIESVFTDQRVRLFDTEITVEAAQTHRRLGLAGASRRTHDVRSAMMAVEGAAVTLERHFDHLNPEERQNLTSLLASGVGRLKRLVGDDGTGSVSFVVADAIAPLAGELASEGIELQVDVPAGLAATGLLAETTEVLRQVAQVAREDTDGRPLTLSGAVVDGSAVIVVGHGPVGSTRLAGIVAAGRPPWEHGIGLHVAERIMREQGGDLGVAQDGPSGRLFVLRLPSGGADPEDPATRT